MITDHISRATMTDRYHRAAALMTGVWTKDMALNATLFPTWIGESNCFWYERETQEGREYRLVNANTKENKVAFDHGVLAAVLAETAESPVDPIDLPISRVSMHLIPLERLLHSNRQQSARFIKKICFTAFDQQWEFDTKSSSCTRVDTFPEEWVISPNGKLAALARNYNLLVREIASGDERVLTKDGEEYFVYAAVGTAWGHPHGSGLQIQWSPDSKKIFTVQRDTRHVKTLPVIHHVPKDNSLRPQVTEHRISYPGDSHIEEYRLLVIDVTTGQQLEPSYHRIPVCRNGWGFFNAGLGWWAMDSSKIYFVDQERGDKIIRVVECDTNTGITRILFEEVSKTQINISVNSEDYPPFFVIPETNELVWWSERSGWAHLYLYDLDTGALKNIITQGDWQVRDIVYFDSNRREVFLQTAGRFPDYDPYYRDLVRVNIDNGEMSTLSAGNHEIITITAKGQTRYFANLFGWDVNNANGVSPTGDFAVITRSRADTVPVSLLICRDGKKIVDIEAADISKLISITSGNWRWPEPVKLLAADNETDIYGLIFRPSDFSSDNSYPVISHVFNSPDLPWVSKGSFSNGMAFGLSYLDAAALAELGFIVVQIDGRGTPYRNKLFQDQSYGWAESASSLDDHVAGLRQLALRYPYMDLNRVGITTHTTGGPGGVQALLTHPDIYKVGVSGWLLDSRLMSAPIWGEKYEGLSGPAADQQYPEGLVEQFRGKLLLMHGMLDTTCPPAATFRVVEALQKANKDFDMLVLPNMGHMIPGYLVRRAWDYFVNHLLNAQPPKEFKLTIFADQFI